jgi:hypothetical protein
MREVVPHSSYPPWSSMKFPRGIPWSLDSCLMKSKTVPHITRLLSCFSTTHMLIFYRIYSVNHNLLLISKLFLLHSFNRIVIFFSSFKHVHVPYAAMNRWTCASFIYDLFLLYSFFFLFIFSSKLLYILLGYYLLIRYIDLAWVKFRLICLRFRSCLGKVKINLLTF